MGEYEDIVLEAKGLTKSFGHFVANSNVSLKLKKGTIHSILGENGAGKSTLMNMLYGMFPPDSGSLSINGEEKKFSSPSQARECGIGMVHQHFYLADPISVLDNAFLGIEIYKAGVWSLLPPPLRPIDRKLEKTNYLKVLEGAQLAINPDTHVENMEITGQQAVEISKVLLNKAKIIILDEPTAVLAPHEIPLFLEKLKDLKAHGHSLLLISHKLSEIMAVSDDITILRKGEVVWTGSAREVNEAQLAKWVVGDDVAPLWAPAATVQNLNPHCKPRLVCKNLFLKPTVDNGKGLHDVSLEIAPGEILGIAGVEGNGQQELISLLRHPKAFPWQGYLGLDEQNLVNLSPHQVCKLGVGFVHEDRLSQGVLPECPIWENFIFGNQHQPHFTKWGLLNKSYIKQQVQLHLNEFNVTPPNPNAILGSLSGGNQQKVVVARALAAHPKLLVACHPTRGVDVGAVRSIHNHLLQANVKGTSILLLSSELDELMAICHRIAVFYSGRVVGILNKDNWSLHKISQLMTRGVEGL